jgi:hypothetical protein
MQRLNFQRDDLFKLHVFDSQTLNQGRENSLYTSPRQVSAWFLPFPRTRAGQEARNLAGRQTSSDSIVLHPPDAMPSLPPPELPRHPPSSFFPFPSLATLQYPYSTDKGPVSSVARLHARGFCPWRLAGSRSLFVVLVKGGVL